MLTWKIWKRMVIWKQRRTTPKKKKYPSKTKKHRQSKMLVKEMTSLWILTVTQTRNQDLEINKIEINQENENENKEENDEEENEEEPLPNGDLEDQEIELQPAHRAEAFDVLSSIEVASRKRSYKVINATKRRKADKDSAWSWWKVISSFLLLCKVYLSHIQLTVDELQTEMIAETNRKRRKLERQRRALKRPQSTSSAYIVIIFFNGA